MTIVFDGISSANRLPGSQVEFSNVRAISGLPAAQQKILLIGQRLSTGTYTGFAPQRIISASQGATLFGRGSMLAGMIAAAIAANPMTELWAASLIIANGAAATVRTMTFAGTATSSGTLAAMIAGVRLTVPVNVGDTATTVATALTSAINRSDIPVAANVAAGVVTVGARDAGAWGNDIDVRINHYDGETLPAGLTCAIVTTAVGATVPDITPIFAAIGDEHYQTIALGFNDANSLSIADTEMTSRWGPSRQIEGRVYAALSGNFSTCAAFGATRNGIHTTLIGNNMMPTPTWKVAATAAAIAALSLQADPARPMTNLVLPGLIAPRIEHRFTKPERNQLLGSGISTLKVLPGNDVAIERLISTYQLDVYGNPDPSYLDVTTTATLAYYRFSWRQRMMTKFPRAKLTQDTIASVRAETIAIARDWFDAGLMEDVDGFIAGLVIERDATNQTQLNILMVPNTVNGLLQLAARIEFIL